MTVTTGPTQINPTHHIKLTDGTDTVGLVMVDGYGNANARGFQRNPTGQPIKMYSGTQKYDDSMPPWTPVTMQDFSGGFGAQEFDNDKSKYYWGQRAYTHDGKFMIGPQPVWTRGLYKWWPADNFYYHWHEITRTYPHLAVKFTTTATTDLTYVQFVAKGDVTSLEVWISPTVVGLPKHTDIIGTGAEVQSVSDTGEYVLTIDTSGVGLSSATDYWLVFHGKTDDTWDSIKILCAASSSSPTAAKRSSFVGVWTTFDTYYYAPMYVMGKRNADRQVHYFELNGSLFSAHSLDTGGTSTLFINGDQGIVKTGSTESSVTLDSGVVSWVADEAIGSVMIIMAGTGSTQPRNHRIIEGNLVTDVNGETTFTFTSDPWDIAPDSTTEVAIVASNKWTQLTPVIGEANPWDSKPVTDVLVANQGVYFAHGDANDMTRMRMYNSSGTWTVEWNAEATDSECTYLVQATDPEGAWIWKLKGGVPAKIAKAPVVDCSGSAAAADLVWETEIAIGDMGSRITNGVVFGEDYGQLHILKEDGLYKVVLASDDTDYVLQVPISGLPPTKDWRNGRAAVVHDTYLFMSWHGTVMRYYRNYFDNIGPNSSDTSVPYNYRGIITDLASYPGMLIASMDAGEDGYSTVNAWNGTGWCNLFTAPAVGMPIRNIRIQSIPGDNVDRLWISCSDNLVWIPISIDPYNYPVRARTYNQYNQAWDAKLQMGLMYAGRKILPKYWKELQWRLVDYDYDVNIVAAKEYPEELEIYDYNAITEWTSRALKLYTSVDIDYTSKEIKPQIRLTASNPNTYIAMESLVFKVAVIEETNWVDTFTVRIADRDKDLNSDFDDYLTADEKITQLSTWSASGTVLTMTSNIGELDSKEVFMMQGGIGLLRIDRDELETTYLCQLICYEV